ncbi:PQQ-dependent dehydrogenase, methanol/ethanol family [Kordiimonas aquimaris]|uniref:PQQ-dependent dehydrogenase, methanol/ethanol family n=1 Tax=Kordiimonas aquimaris TaxID=707591 RepID=UPI0021D3160E|nr:PQQ-dependent dehydrogenase, methanol/ethanol family [Kordiimonas aquimaris]
MQLRLTLIALLLALTACEQREHASSDTNPAKQATIDTNFIEATSPNAEWLTHGGSYTEQRHSPLDTINTENVATLGVTWTYDLATNRGVEATPIIANGVMYVTSAWSVVYALDAKTGEELWVYDPEVDRAVGVKACCDVVNRGVAIYGDKILVGVIDGRLEALDAKTGKIAWSTITVDQAKPYTITGTPRVIDGLVLIGNGGAELGVRGYISAYNIDDGTLSWRFYTVPNPSKQPDGAVSDDAFTSIGNITWGDDGAWVTDGGGGTVWDSIIYDSVNDQIIFGVGNGSPWNREIRDPSGGDNLFLSSIVAVDVKTGTYKWHFQTTPGDNWDYTATQSLILANLPLGENGAERRVVMQAPKNGFFYVLDAETGVFISGEAFGPVNWATGLDESGRPVEVAAARYGTVPYLQLPGPLGAHNWHPMAYNPIHKLAYIPAQEIPQAYSLDPLWDSKPAVWNTGADFAAGTPVDMPPELMKFLRASLKGRLIAWDPVKQEARWTVEHENAWNGGILSTAGNLVFQGKLGGEFSAYNAANGTPLWHYDLKSGAVAGPVTYEIDGIQYVTITTGWGSGYALHAGYAYDKKVSPTVGKVVTFKLGGTADIADPEMIPIDRTPKSERIGTAETLQSGVVHYARNCLVCHGPVAISSGVLPDLRWSSYTADSDAWQAVVSEGVLADSGMVSFSKLLTPEEIEAIRAYVISQAHNAVAQEN